MKKTIYFVFPLSIIALFVFFVYKNEAPISSNSLSVEVPKNRVSIDFLENVTIREAIRFKNFDLFLIEGKTQADNIEYVPLNRAMENKSVKITETSNVNQLEISNSSDQTIFIHAGDIVKGGKQDRTLTYDLLVSAGTKNMKISSFCVESRRWEQRGNEEASSFSSNTKMLATRDLKISSKKNKQQSSVWSEVEATQNKLSDKVSAYYEKDVDVKANASASSLELALDNKDLIQLKKEYKSHFNNLDLENVVGFAYAINGELYNVDIYNNELLFKELYDKLLAAAVVEAITELDVKAQDFSHLKLKDLVFQLSLNKDFKTTSEKINDRTRWVTKEDNVLIIFTSIDSENMNKWIHHNIIVKVDSDSASTENNLNREVINN